MRWLLDRLSPIPFPPWFMRLGGRLNAAWLQFARGRGPLNSDVLVLTTRGRRSGRARSTALLYFEDGAKRYVVASFAGVDRHPAWYLNLVAERRVIVEVRGDRTPCLARVLDETGAAELWPLLDASYGGFTRYRARTPRQIPIVELTPDPDRQTSSLKAASV